MTVDRVLDVIARQRPSGIAVRNLFRSFGGEPVLAGITLDIPPGEFVALIGKSGCGKSTLLKAIAGLDRDAIKSGSITASRSCSVLFQDSRLLPWLTALDNVILGLNEPRAREKGLAALRNVGLEGRETAWPSVLSGGEQQRVALARSLARSPELLLADEPFGALDALTRLRMHELLAGLVRSLRPTVLLVTHDVDEALKLADRVLVMEAGRIILDLRIEAAHQRRHGDPRLQDLRRQFLAALGVEESLDELRPE